MFAHTIGNFVTKGIKVLMIILIMASSVVANADVSTIREVNSQVNQSRYIKDIDLYNASDYFATPNEFKANGGGDCEDFAIAKYFMLIDSNISPEKLFFTYIRSDNNSELHMVLAYYETPDSDPLILDNTRSRLMYLSEMVDTSVLVSYNYSNNTFYNATNEAYSTDKISNTSVYAKWFDLKDRVNS